MKKSLLFATLASLEASVFAASSQEDTDVLVARFVSKEGIQSCVNVNVRYRAAKGDRVARIVGDEDNNMVKIEIITRYMQFISDIPRELLYWKKASGEEIYVDVVERAGEACFYATFNAKPFHSTPQMRAKYFQ